MEIPVRPVPEVSGLVVTERAALATHRGVVIGGATRFGFSRDADPSLWRTPAALRVHPLPPEE